MRTIQLHQREAGALRTRSALGWWREPILAELELGAPILRSIYSGRLSLVGVIL
jgi:hypothetical protein